MLRSLSVYLAWVVFLMVVGAMSIAWLVLLLFTPSVRAVPSLSSYTSALALAVTGLAALVIPAWRWRSQGLLPDVPAADQHARIARGERSVAIGHVPFVFGAVVPSIAVIVLPDSESAFMAFYAASFVTLPLCLVFARAGLSHVNSAGSWPKGRLSDSGRACAILSGGTIT